jgi:DNA-binding response OmpR family regulator
MPQPRVLLVEDNRLLRWWMACSLEQAGFCVAAPETSLEAMEVCSRCPLDLLVTDWHLGGGEDGFQVLSQARQKSPNVFAILISAEADDSLATAARGAGFDVVIQKPFPVAEITAAVHAFEQKSRERHSEVA